MNYTRNMLHLLLALNVQITLWYIVLKLILFVFLHNLAPLQVTNQF